MTRKAVNIHVFYYATLSLAMVIPFSASLSTWCIIVLAANWIVEGGLKSKIKMAFHSPVMVMSALFYLWEVSGLWYTHHFSDGFYHAQSEASFLVLPLLFFGYPVLPKGLRDRTFFVFVLSVFLTSLYCLYMGMSHYGHTGDASYLFYHKLVAPVHQHAVYFSIYTFICVVWLFKAVKNSTSKIQVAAMIFLLIYFSGLLFLLRSKMLVGIIFLFAVYQLFIALRNRPVVMRQMMLSQMLIIGIIATLCTSNPLSHQFSALKGHDLGILRTRSFDPGDYFDEVQLRLLLWKFTFEILHESDSWLWGVSPGDARYRMNHEIVSHHMYTGIPGTPDRGYLNYNDHNQYMETLLRSGLIGLLLLLSLLFVLIRSALSSHDMLLLVLVLTFSLVFLTESVLERQIGIVPFFFFICLLVSGKPRDLSKVSDRNRHG